MKVYQVLKKLEMKKILIILIAIVSFYSCDKIIMDEDYSTEDPFVSFDYLWNQVDKRYSYFDVKGIDWDEIGEKYRDMVYDGISDDSLFQVMGTMLSELKDDHTNLFSTFDVSFFGIRYYSKDNFEWRVIVDNYIGTDYYTSGPFVHDYIADGQIGYIRFGSFTGTVDDVNLNFILNRYKSTKGLIFDIRENGGGAATDVFSILERFIDDKTVVYKSRIRNGEDHEDFSELKGATVEPSDEIRYTDKPVIFLCDRGTYSAGSFTSLSTLAIPNITLMGDTTGGGLGLPNGGQLPNGWTYRFSVTQALSIDQSDDLEAGLVDKVNSENFEQGVPPDVVVEFNWSDMTKDEILDAAVERILYE